MNIAVTGHRPERLKGQERNIEVWLENQLSQLKKEYCGDIYLITGMARGIDQMAALIAIRLDVPIFCYFGYRHKLSPLEDYIVSNSAGVRYETDSYWKGCFIQRDHRMVDDCDILLGVWDGKAYGGTFQTIEYAKEKGKDIRLYYGLFE